MQPTRPFLTGIAGPSASGKSTLARALANHDGDGALLFPVDAWYHDLRHLPIEERARWNFDEPAAIEWDRLLESLDALCAGSPAEAPVYDYATHTRTGRTRRLEPAPLVLLDGLHVLHEEGLRGRLDAAIYIDCPRAVCLERRIARDTAERGRTERETRAQFDAQVWPMAERFVLPSRAHAGLVLDGQTAPKALETAARTWLEGLPGFPGFERRR